MTSEGSPNGTSHRRSSITQAALSQLFQRGSSTIPNGGNGQANGAFDSQRRRLSVTTIGLSGTSPTNPPSFNIRRGSMSANSDSIDESAIEDEEMPGMSKTLPNTPFVRRMSFGGSTIRGYRPGGNSPGNGNNPTSPPSSLGRKASLSQGSAISAALSAAGRRASTAVASSAGSQASNTMPSRAPSDNANSRADQQGFNWSEQLRSRAESSVTGARPSLSLASSPPRAEPNHDRARSISDMMQPPVQTPTVLQPKQEPRKPDAFQERILKGDFYMD
ncbi:hypothetical protein C2857_002613 [Epichloe festucae Fl1]|uniref:Uncharacterized protein n=1 Tax=Epichloe festucae (strain Fl1) TaxID=877507 RepID=A0A7S9PV23_EPIFF|nr:hypothetical protein C2857_002613 [Epichloe festucae Fl1]